MNQPPTCVIADDHPLMREILRMRLEIAGLEVVAEAADGPEAVRLVARCAPDVLVVDLNMPGLRGIEVIERVADLGCSTRSIMYAAAVRPQDVQRALTAGACGFLDKSASNEMLTLALDTVIAGGRFIDPTVAGDLLAPHASAPSGRELQVLELMADGLQNKEIAVRLALSTETIKTHVTSLMGKLGTHSRTGAVAIAIRSQLVS